jgi:hypothetical protein
MRITEQNLKVLEQHYDFYIRQPINFGKSMSDMILKDPLEAGSLSMDHEMTGDQSCVSQVDYQLPKLSK